MAVVSLRKLGVLAGAAAAVLAAGCSGAGPAPASQGSSSAAASSPAAAGPSPAPATSAPASPTPPSWPDTPRKATSNGPAATLTGVAVGRHDTFDRLVFDFSGGVPGYDVRYVSQVLADGSGQPVALQGQAFLHIVFTPVALGQGYAGPGALSPGYPVLLQVKSAGGFEGYLSYGAGLSQRVGFNVFTLANPDRVVIDVAHG